VDGVVCPTFKDACQVRGLLRDDNEWIQCLQEAGDMHTGTQLRTLFATILIHGVPTTPENLWISSKTGSVMILPGGSLSCTQMIQNQPQS